MARRAKKKIPLFYNRITALILVVAVGFLGLTVFDLLQKEREAAMRRAEAERELKSIQDREQLLTEELAVLETPRGREALVRNTFDVAKEGEEVIVILDPLPATTTNTNERTGFISWLLQLFE